MLIQPKDARLFVELIGIVSELVDEARLRISKSGLKIVAIDPANVALVSLRMSPSAFSRLEIESEEEEQLCVNLSDFKAVLKRVSPSSSLVLSKEKNMLRVEIIEKIKRVFSLALIDIEGEEKDVPRLEFASRVEMTSDMLHAAIEDAAVVADACSFFTTRKNESFVIEAKGLHSSRSEFTSDEVKLQVADARAKYSLEYLQKFMRAVRISEKAVLHFSSDYPCKIDFFGKDFELSFILAPRVETED